jgi:hypothetical protein
MFCQEISENGKSSLEETGISNEATDCKGPEPESAANSELPRNLIFNCIATLLAIKVKHSPASLALILHGY